MKMRKSLIALAVTVTMAAGVAQAATVTFSDAQGNWAQADISRLADLNIMAGYNDGMFHPDAWVTRAEFGNMAVKSVGLPPSKIQLVPGLQNVTTNQWNFGTVDNQAWVSAYPSGVFRPENPVRRAEVMAGLASLLNRPIVTEAEANQILGQYPDAAQVPPNLRRQVATAIKYNLIETDPQYGANQLDPLRPVNRAELAAMLNNMYENRDIAIVQNGQVIAQRQGMSVGANVGDVADVNANLGTQGVNVGADVGGVTVGAGVDETTGMATVRGSGQPGFGAETLTSPSVGGASDVDELWWKSSAVPFRASADTLDVYRRVEDMPLTSAVKEATVNLAPNTTFIGTVAKAVYSEFNKPGDPILLILDNAIFDASNKVVAPAGSRVLGQVAVVQSNNRTQDNARMGLVFSNIVTPAGERVPINATVANADGILSAGALQGVVFQPQRSAAALKREIFASQGSWYGTKIGKEFVLETPYITLGSQQPVTGLDPKITPAIILGVGDKLQVRLTSVGLQAQPAVRR